MSPDAGEARAEARTPTLDHASRTRLRWSQHVVDPSLRRWCDAPPAFLRIVLSSGVEPTGQGPMTTPRSAVRKRRVTALSNPGTRLTVGPAHRLSTARNTGSPHEIPTRGIGTATRAGEIVGAVAAPNHEVLLGFSDGPVHPRHRTTEPPSPFLLQANGGQPRTDKGETP